MSIPHDRLAASLSAADHDALFAHEDAVDTPWAVVESVLVDHCERSEAQLQEGDRLWEGSVERNRGQMDKNRI